MTQTQSKQTPSLVSVDRSGRLPMAVRSADGRALESGMAPPTKLSAAAVASVSSADVFADFVFEEAGATVLAAPARATTAALAPVPKVNTSGASTPADAEPAAVKVAEVEPQRAEGHATHKAAEVTSAPVPGVPARGDLDLRTKLNQKETELLALRIELSSRDRLLLDLNSTSLEIERSRIELSEQLEQNALLLNEALARVRAHEADRATTARRIEDLQAGFRRSEDNWKRKNAAEVEALRGAHTAELCEQAAAHTTKLERLERSHAAEVARVHAMHIAAEQEASEKHAGAIKNLEAASNTGLSNAVSTYTKTVCALREAQENALAKTVAADAAALEAALAAAASDKAGVLAEAESAHRATQSELSATLATAQFLERAQVSQSERSARQETQIASLEEALKRATAQSDAAADTLARLRRAFAAGLGLLNAPLQMPEGD